ncbi:enoyl-CoA hydratase-related protein [Thermodesulfobacteriota bacterium]
MSYETLIYEKYGDGNRIGRITLNRPERLNALSDTLLDELMGALREAEDDPDVRVIVLKAAGRAFSAGYDLAEAYARGEGAEGEDEVLGLQETIGPLRTYLRRGVDAQLRFWSLSKPTIAQVHGYCLAGGSEWAMMADLVIAADDALFGHPATRSLGTPRNACLWPLLIGMRKSKELLYTGDSITGKEAERLGMINKAVPADALEDEVNRMATRIAHQAADSLAIHKHSVNVFYEEMGIRAALQATADFDAMYSFTTQAQEWKKAVQERGPKEAVRERDAKYKE